MKTSRYSVDLHGENSIAISRQTIFSFIYLLFLLAFVVTPYWTVMVMPGRLSQLLLGSILVMIGVAWAYIASAAPVIGFSLRTAGSLFALVLLVIAMNIMPLISEIAWRGDEDFHFARTDHLVMVASSGLYRSIVLISLLIAGHIATTWAARRSDFTMLIVAAAQGLLILLLASPLPLSPFMVVRYPFLPVWTVVPLVTCAYPFYGNTPPEWIYRITPLACACMITLLYASRVSKGHFGVKILAGLFAPSIPLFYYYSAILYCEMLAVFLMLIIALSADQMLTAPSQQLKRHPAWYGLILLGFVKETVLGFLAAFLIVRFLCQLGRHRVPEWGVVIKNEALYAVLITLPWVTYMVFRNFSGVPGRKFIPAWGNLIRGDLWHALGTSLVDQFGLSLLFAAIGLVLISRKRFHEALFLILAMLGTITLHFLDIAGYVGYSRFNLFLMPSVLVLCIPVMMHILRQKTVFAAGILCTMVVINLISSPIHIDGSRRPGWGDSATSVVEWSYPWRKAGDVITEHFPESRVLLAGLTYPYSYIGRYIPVDVVLEQMSQSYRVPVDIRLSEAIAHMKRNQFDALMFVPAGGAYNPEVPKALSLEAVVGNRANEIAIYTLSGSNKATRVIGANAYR